MKSQLLFYHFHDQELVHIYRLSESPLRKMCVYTASQICDHRSILLSVVERLFTVTVCLLAREATADSLVSLPDLSVINCSYGNSAISSSSSPTAASPIAHPPTLCPHAAEPISPYFSFHD